MDNPFLILEHRLETIERYLEDLLSYTSSLPQLPDNKDSEEETTFKAEELAKYLGCSRATVLRYKRDGVFPFYQAGRSFYFKKAEVDQALSSKQTKVLSKTKQLAKQEILLRLK
jgi:excisionase family DNA binding protein